MAAPRPRLVPVGLDFAPPISLDVKNVDVIHPLDAIVSTKVIDLAIDETASSGDPGTWVLSGDYWLNPGEGCCIKIEDVIELPKLIRLSSENVDLLIKSDSGML